MNKKIILTAIVSLLSGVILTLPVAKVIAEQSGTSPESGVVSRIAELFGFYKERSQGSEEAGDWGDYGSMWNRIFSNRVDYSLQGYSTRDNFAGTYNGGVGPEDYMEEESEWVDYSVDTNTVWKDERTGLYWSADRGVLTANNFTLSTCDFFTSEPRSSYDGSDLDCGGTIEAPHAINYCATLDYGGRSDWYLPSQQELMQAYIDGMYNQAGETPEEAATFTWRTTGGGGYYSWSSSEVSGSPTRVWYVRPGYGGTANGDKTGTYAVRCVARD